MDIKELDADVSVTGQITPDDVKTLAEKGFRGVICNRPDHESPDQPDYSTIQAAAEAAGIAIRYIPIVPGLAGAAEVEQFSAALKEMDGPILAYCRSGARSTALYTAAKQNADA